MTTNKRLPYNKRHIAPAILSSLASTGLSAGIGLATSSVTNSNAKRDMDAQMQDLLKQYKVEDVANLDKINMEGYNGVEYYASGGVLPTSGNKGKYATTGGNLESLSSNAEVAEGNTHGEKTIDNQYGITLHDVAGNPKAEIEDDEVLVDNQMVFSDRLKYNSKSTYAQIAKKIANKAGKIEEKLEKTKDIKDRNGYERSLAGLKMAHEALFDKQENTKLEEGHKELEMLAYGGKLPKYAYGNRIEYPNDGTEGTMSNLDFAKSLKKSPKNPSFLAYLAPSLIDNLANAALTANSPKVPMPVLNRAVPLETSVNVNPQLTAIARNKASNRSTILGNTANSNDARANVAAANLESTYSQLNVLRQKENTELGLRNQNNMNKQQVNNSNIDLTNNYKSNNFTRLNDIQSRISENIADVSKNIGETITTKQMDKYYDEVELLDLLDDPTGEKAKSASMNPYFKKSPEMDKALKDRLDQRNKKRKTYSFNNNNNYSIS